MREIILRSPADCGLEFCPGDGLPRCAASPRGRAATPKPRIPVSPFLAELVGTMLLITLGDGVVANVVLNKTKGQNSG